MPKALTERQKLAYTIREMEIQSLLETDSVSELETDILYLNHLLTKRYLVTHSTKKNPLIYSVDNLINLPPARFKQLMRTTHCSFGRLCELIKDDPLFHNKSQNKQRPLEIQLAIGLCRLGSNGNGASLGRIQMTFGVGAGTIGGYTKKIINAILNLKEQSVMWPTEDKRKESSQVMQLEGWECISNWLGRLGQAGRQALGLVGSGRQQAGGQVIGPGEAGDRLGQGRQLARAGRAGNRLGQVGQAAGSRQAGDWLGRLRQAAGRWAGDWLGQIGQAAGSRQAADLSSKLAEDRIDEKLYLPWARPYTVPGGCSS
ncbi:hypothetical protein PPACK8108_LOCUS2582 [Phakopsora pachyrhizi]|uniref:Uncharacterized protein n=1 Tax=Phakopsora pachyrhizi TaxID=170000 RepID=A0AAV0AI77_PHAPC|nr:hypothetical protein PPACK8108_LOCUS2582 [Phakopsora pachyrhizi]